MVPALRAEGGIVNTDRVGREIIRAVVAGLVPAIHDRCRCPRTWMPGTSPGITGVDSSYDHPSSTILPRDLPLSSSACARLRLAALMVPKV